MLVASSIYEACRYFDLLQKTPLKGRCGVVTSYDPNAADITKEDTGANTETDREFLYRTYTALLEDVAPAPGKSRTETYENAAKEKFVGQPAEMRRVRLRAGHERRRTEPGGATAGPPEGRP